MKLYYSPGACSLSPHIVAIEAGVLMELVRVDLGTGQTESGEDYRKINPDGYEPALVLADGDVLTEGPAIVQYLADQAVDKELAPVYGSRARYRLMQWLNFISTELHKTYSPLFDPRVPPDCKAQFTERLAERFAHVAAVLETQPYLMGERFSVADAYLFTVSSWVPHVGLDLSPWPALTAYQGRVAARPAVRQALAEEGLLK